MSMCDAWVSAALASWVRTRRRELRCGGLAASHLMYLLMTGFPVIKGIPTQSPSSATSRDLPALLDPR